MKKFLLGLGLAALLGTFYATGNSLAGARQQIRVVHDASREGGETIRRRESRRGIFPHAYALLTIPAYVFGLQWVRRRNAVPESPAALKTYAWTVVKWAASLFAAFVSAVTAIWITGDVRFLAAVFFVAWCSTALLGYVAAEGGARIVARRRST